MSNKEISIEAIEELQKPIEAKLMLEERQNVAPAPKQPEAKHSWHNTNEWKLDTTVTNQQLLNYVNATDKKEAQKWSLLVDLTKFLNSLQENK